MVMVHGDNRGLILPPNVANIQVSIECISPIFSIIHVHVLCVFALHFVFTEACFIHNIHLHLFLIPLLLQVIVVPCGITVSVDDTKKNEITKYCESVISSLTDAGIRAKGDFRYNYSPGWKFNHWELKVLKDTV